MDYLAADWDSVLGIFLLIVAVSGNFVAETLGCQTRKILSTNIYAKNIIILMITYFSLGFATTNKDEIQHPFSIISKTLIIWISFLIFNKMDIQYTIISIVGLFFILVLKDFIEYYISSKNNTEIIPILLHLMNFIFVGVCVSVLIGFLFYFKKQYNDYGKSFSFLTFIFGKSKCNNVV